MSKRVFHEGEIDLIIEYENLSENMKTWGRYRVHAQGVTVLRDASVTVCSVTQVKCVTFWRDAVRDGKITKFFIGGTLSKLKNQKNFKKKNFSQNLFFSFFFSKKSLLSKKKTYSNSFFFSIGSPFFEKFFTENQYFSAL